MKAKLRPSWTASNGLPWTLGVLKVDLDFYVLSFC